jgi:hypothetical protein
MLSSCNLDQSTLAQCTVQLVLLMCWHAAGVKVTIFVVDKSFISVAEAPRTAGLTYALQTLTRLNSCPSSTSLHSMASNVKPENMDACPTCLLRRLHEPDESRAWFEEYKVTADELANHTEQGVPDP